MKSKSFRSVGEFGSGSLMMVHDMAAEEYRVQFDDGSHVFITFEYGSKDPVRIHKEEARENASLALDLIAQTLRALSEGKF